MIKTTGANMKHKFAGEICVYCNNAPADTSDHAVGRKFFLVERRANLPQVPSCQRCNNLKSKAENYLMIVLSFGAKHPDAKRNFEELVKPRLENKANAKLFRKLQRDYQRSGGRFISLDHKPLDDLFAMVAKALAWQHFRVRMTDGYSSIASVFTNDGKGFFDQTFAKSGKKAVSGDLGEGTFRYEGVQVAADPRLTLWRFEIYGGVDFGGDENGRNSLAIAVTGRPEMIRNLTYSGFLKDPKSPKVGRNEPCPCGSGKKHKKCCDSPAKREARERAYAKAAARDVTPSTYQPIAAHGCGRTNCQE